jgi:hypothetical protein
MAFAGTTNPIVAGLAASRDTQLGDQGNFFVANTGVPGTGQISGVVTTFVETTPYITLFNSSNTLSIYPMYLLGHITVAGTGVTPAINWTFTLDAGNRFTSGGAALNVQNVNMNSNLTSAAVVNAGVLVATAATGARRIVGNSVVRDTAVEIVHDTYAFNFGGGSQYSSSSVRKDTTTPTYALHNMAPLVIGPLQTLVVVRWATSMASGSTAELHMGWTEK